MPRITIVDVHGQAHAIDAPDETSVMQVAMANGIEGIVAECNGNAACATCHVYVDGAFADRLPPISDNEADMLDFTAAERRPGSRLSCQVKLTDALEGLLVTVADTQI